MFFSRVAKYKPEINKNINNLSIIFVRFSIVLTNKVSPGEKSASNKVLYVNKSEHLNHQKFISNEKSILKILFFGTRSDYF